MNINYLTMALFFKLRDMYSGKYPAIGPFYLHVHFRDRDLRDNNTGGPNYLWQRSLQTRPYIQVHHSYTYTYKNTASTKLHSPKGEGAT